MDETLLAAAICKDRKAYEKLLRIGFDTNDFSEAGRCVIDAATEQYKRDESAQSITADALRSQVERRFGAGSMADSIMDFVGRFPADVSTINVTEEYRLLRLARCSTSLATLLASGQHGEETADTLAKYEMLVAGEEGEKFKERLTIDDFAEYDGDRIPLYPKSLNDFIGGGVERGHNVTVYARPEAGKSLFAINNAAMLAKQGYKILYVANEEPARDVTRRVLSRIARIDIEHMRDREVLNDAFKAAGKAYKNWNLLHKANISARDIRRQCARLRPDIVIVDQLKNLYVTEDNRALQLDRVARQIREIGIEHNCATLSITQAGESAEGELVLRMTDVEWSNTGIPGAADLLIGIGVNDEFMSQDKRMLSICKNKVNSQHGAFPVWINPKQTAMLSKARAA